MKCVGMKRELWDVRIIYSRSDCVCCNDAYQEGMLVMSAEVHSNERVGGDWECNVTEQ